MAAIAHPKPAIHLELLPVLPARTRRPVAPVHRRRRVGAVLLAVALVALLVLAVQGLAGAGADGHVQVGPPAAPGRVVDLALYGSSGAEPPAGSFYVVQPGDTLWSIARALSPDGDVAAEAARLAERHGSSAVQVGDRLVLR